MNIIRKLGLAAAALTIPALAATAPAMAQTTPHHPPAVTRHATTHPATVTQITTAHHRGYDRVTFTFTNGLPAQRSWAYVPRLVADGSGKVIPVQGHAVIRVRFYSATSRAAGTLTPRLPEVRQLKAAGNFEGVVSEGIGVTKREPVTMHVLTGPNRVYFDVRTP